MSKLKQAFFICVLIFCTSLLFAEGDFYVKQVEIKGLQGISTETVMTYLPVKTGEQMTSEKTAKIIQALYKTGFFDHIALSRKGDTLIIAVIQRPIIASVEVSGNKQIPTDKLMEALKKQGLASGQVFNQSLLEKVKAALSQEYFTVGKYNAKIDIKLTHEERNRVSIKIDISEGQEAKIHQIKIIGNHAFTDKELLKQFSLSTTGLLSFFTHDDQYSREKFDADLETLRSYYMDRGYLGFKINSHQVSITPDKKEVYVLINVTEGPQFKISGYRFDGKMILTKEQLENYVTIKKGEYFSRQKIMNQNQKITQALGDKGYANANVDVQPQVDEKNDTVFVVFRIEPGPHIYVRHITFTGNYRTNDEVYRRELTQYEGALLSSKNIRESKRNIALLPFVQQVDVATQAVPDKPDMMDVNYTLKERPAAEFQGGIGYSILDKFMVHASLNQKNFLGTGKSLGANISVSSPSKTIAINYTNPYYTQSGISRSVSLYGNNYNASRANISDYSTNNYGFSVGYSIPMAAENNYLTAGFGYDNNIVQLGNSPATEMTDFTNDHGRHFYQLSANVGWYYQGLDRNLFPTKGLQQSVSLSGTVPVSSKQSLQYYKLGYQARYYHPIWRDFIGNARFNVNYGNGYGKYKGSLPFFKNFYAGGIGSVRGYEGNSLGPKDSKGDALGGNFEIDGSISLIFPNPISDNIRTAWFVDGGQVYNKVHFNDMRYSTGLEIDWQSPIALLNFSLAKALNPSHDDNTELFQFSMGTAF